MTMPRTGIWPVGGSGDINDQRQEWVEYVNAGGLLLNFQDWIDAGMPTAREEQAAYSLLERVDAYLMEQLNNGNIDRSEYLVQVKDIENQLFGEGQYQGNRKTVATISSPVITSARNWWANLPAERQKEIDQQAREAQQQVETIAQQRGQLPLGVRGSLEQQVGAGYSAIRSLENQLTTAPVYLQDTIRSQIAQLQTAIDRTREDVRTSYRIKAEDTRPSRGGTREAWMNLEKQAEKAKEAYLTPPKVSSGYEYRPDVVREQREAAKERWLQLKERADVAKHAWLISDEQEALQAEEDEARDEAFREGTYRSPPDRTGSYRSTFPYPDEPAVMEWVPYKKEQPPSEPYIPPAFKDVALSSGQPTWKSWFENKYSSVVSEFFQKPSEDLTEKGWSGFLEDERKRIREDFMKQSPYQRGERPSVYQPRLRTVAY